MRPPSHLETLPTKAFVDRELSRFRSELMKRLDTAGIEYNPHPQPVETTGVIRVPLDPEKAPLLYARLGITAKDFRANYEEVVEGTNEVITDLATDMLVNDEVATATENYARYFAYGSTFLWEATATLLREGYQSSKVMDNFILDYLKPVSSQTKENALNESLCHLAPLYKEYELVRVIALPDTSPLELAFLLHCAEHPKRKSFLGRALALGWKHIAGFSFGYLECLARLNVDAHSNEITMMVSREEGTKLVKALQLRAVMKGALLGVLMAPRSEDLHIPIAAVIILALADFIQFHNVNFSLKNDFIAHAHHELLHQLSTSAGVDPHSGRRRVKCGLMEYETTK